LAKIGRPGVKTTDDWVRKDLCDMRNAPGHSAGLGKTGGSGIACGGGSAQRSTSACTRSCGSGHKKECKRGGACARCQGQPKRTPRVAVALCRKPAMAELRWWNTGDGVPAPAVDYGP